MFNIVFMPILFALFMHFKRMNSISAVFLFILLFTSTGALIIDKTPSFESAKDVLNILYTTILIYIFASGFKGYHVINKVNIYNYAAFNLFERCVLFCCFISIIINTIALRVVLSYVEDFNAFKQGGEDTTYFFYNYMPIPHSMLSLSAFVSAFSFFALPLHFYYMQMRNKRKSILHLIASAALIVNGLLMFSRSAIIQFALLYIVFLILFYPSFAPKLKRSIIRLLLVAGVTIGFVFVSISVNRFDEKSRLEIPKGSLIKDDLIFSFFDYGCQWYKNGFETMRKYNFEPLGGKLSNTLYVQFFTGINQTEVRQKAWPNDWWKFLSFYTIIQKDLGIIGSILLALLFKYLAVKLRPKRGCVSIYSLFSFIPLYVIPLMAFTGNLFETLFYHLSVVVLVAFIVFSKIKLRHRYSPLVVNGEPMH